MKWDLLASFAIAVIWGAFPFAMASVLTHTTVHMSLLCLSFVFFVCTLAYSILYTDGGAVTVFQEMRKLPLKTFFLLAAATILGIFVKSVLYFNVIQSTSRLNVTLAIMSLSSAVSLLIGIYIHKYALNRGTLIGIAVTCLGVFLMLLNQVNSK